MSTNKEQSKEHLAMNKPPIVSQQEWEAARQQLLVKENRSAMLEAQRLRRQMPWAWFFNILGLFATKKQRKRYDGLSGYAWLEKR